MNLACQPALKFPRTAENLIEYSDVDLGRDEGKSRRSVYEVAIRIFRYQRPVNERGSLPINSLSATHVLTRRNHGFSGFDRELRHEQVSDARRVRKEPPNFFLRLLEGWITENLE